jgi:hypothetical protein
LPELPFTWSIDYWIQPDIFSVATDPISAILEEIRVINNSLLFDSIHSDHPFMADSVA